MCFREIGRRFAQKGRIGGQASLIVVIGLLCIALLFYGAPGTGSVQDLRSKDEVSSLEVITCNLGDLGGYGQYLLDKLQLAAKASNQSIKKNTEGKIIPFKKKTL